MIKWSVQSTKDLVISKSDLNEKLMRSILSCLGSYKQLIPELARYDFQLESDTIIISRNSDKLSKAPSKLRTAKLGETPENIFDEKFDPKEFETLVKPLLKKATQESFQKLNLLT